MDLVHKSFKYKFLCFIIGMLLSCKTCDNEQTLKYIKEQPVEINKLDFFSEISSVYVTIDILKEIDLVDEIYKTAFYKKFEVKLDEKKNYNSKELIQIIKFYSFLNENLKLIENKKYTQNKIDYYLREFSKYE